ncbi:HD domain-containing protein [Oceanobacillus kapialis]|uniref:HD domain-containing protein n=1 Tax=Oceanobacillus kapialis TaxID=481353 RepID=A0ABW5PZE3_9BACI
MKETLQEVMQVIKLAEKLKYELRHSWLSNGRRESVAEHTWRLSLMAMLIEPLMEEKLDTAKLLKMIIIHDLVEAEATDVPAFDTLENEQVKALKQAREQEAIDHLRDMLPRELGQEIHSLWMEFEEKETLEAKTANALDKLEAQIQHNEASIDTWLPVEHGMSFMLGKHTDFHPVLKELKDMIEDEAEKKMMAAGIQTAVLKQGQ